MSRPLPDENVLVIPDAWRAEIHPRRGGLSPVPEITFDPSAAERVREWLKANMASMEPVLYAEEDDDRQIIKAARAYLQGEADPKGAATVAVLQRMVATASKRPPQDLWIDTWIAEHGLAFAACACAELDQLEIGYSARRASTYIEHREFYRGHEYLYFPNMAGWATGAAGRRMRALLAAASEEDYAEAVRRLADHRLNDVQRLVVSYLVPTRQDWVEECLAVPEPSMHGVRLLWCAVGSADQIGNLYQEPPYDPWERAFGFLPGMLASMIEGVGPAIAPVLATAIDAESDVKVRKPYLEALSLIPTDEAFGLIVQRSDQNDARPALVAMMERFPRRAVRLLAPLASGNSRPVAALLAEHLRVWPELADDVPAEALAVIKAAGGTKVDEAAPDDLPKVLTSGSAASPPSWAAPAFMPQLLLRGRNLALPAAATARLIEALSKTGPRRAPAAPVRTAMEACDPGSLAEFGWALFDRWRKSGDVRDNGWPLSQLRWTGDAETSRRLGAMVRSATFYEGYKLALSALAVLAATGTDVALMQLSLSAGKSKAKGLKKRAKKLLDQLSEERGLTPEQLADRLVPDFGLDAEGGMTLDYGPRRFQVGFDEQLRPQVFDEGGKLRKSLPKPGVKDDPELAPAAHRAFAGLKKDVRALAGDQIRRMERAMVERRYWAAGDFQRLLVHHPLMWHITRRLVWWHEDDDGAAAAFRLAEDRTAADKDDDALTLPSSGAVCVAHPLRLGGDLGTWSEAFADYEIMQPFPQLGRPTYTLGADEQDATELKRFAGRDASPGGVLGLERQGWVRGSSEDGGMQRVLTLSLPEGSTLEIEITPGIPAWHPGHTEPQRVENVRIIKGRLGDLDPVTASELLLTLHTLTEAD